MKAFRILLWLMVLVVGLGVAVVTLNKAPEAPPERATSEIGGDFTMVGADGGTVTSDTLAGKPYLIFFGFTHCPDICPYTLYTMGQAMDELGADADKVQTVFVSVDPERDTPDVLSQYLDSNGFPENLVGLTGSPEQVDHMKAVFKIYSAKVEDASSTAGYTVDHTSLIYLMDEQGRYVDFILHDALPADIAARVKTYLETGR